MGMTKWEYKHDRILATAAALFSERGFTGVAVDQVAERAGVSKATVYRHFKDKETLFVEVVTHLCRDAGVRDMELNYDEPDHALRFIGLEFCRRFNHPLIRSLFLTVAASARSIPKVGDLFWATGPGYGFEVIKNILARLRVNHPDVDVELDEGAWMFLGAVSGRQMLELMSGKDALVDERELEMRVAKVVSCFLRGIGYVPKADQ